MKLLYDFFIIVYSFVARAISFHNPKAKLWINGRVDILKKIKTALENNKNKIVWMHCASLGEFEQGRPLIEKLKLENADLKILVTFFSPSGYEIHKNYKGANWVFYLPIDTKKNAENFLEIVKPNLILFVKYEYWFYYLTEAKKRKIAVLLISGIFRESQPFFKWYGKLHLEMLTCFTHLFVQNDESNELLKTVHSKNNISINGDTRFDRVIEIAKQDYHNKIIENFVADNKVIVAGSTWLEDDEELDHYANKNTNIKFIIVPHNIDVERVSEILFLYKNAVLYSEYENITDKTNVLIIDNVGLLNKLYKYATICYIGGGFGGDGVHNVLEAAVYFKPVIFGPIYQKFEEAIDLVNCYGALTINSALELEAAINDLLTDKEKLQQMEHNAGTYVKNNEGSSQEIINFIYANRLLTN